MNLPDHNEISGTESESKVSRIIEEAILEDIGMGDITTEATVDADAVGSGHILVKEQGIIAGLEIASMVFRIVDEQVSLNFSVSDGASVHAGTVAATIRGPLHGILKSERTALNILQRMSGIATLTRKFVDTIQGTKARITDTRKTAPGIRVLDKLAVTMGGGVNHRFGLDDMILIKDNHIAAAGGITPAVKKCLAYLSQSSHKLKIEVETKNLQEVAEVLSLPGIHRVMLDNFSIDDMKKAVLLINGKLEVEASGNVSLTTVRPIAETGVDVISVGALTHSPKALDISLDIHPSSFSRNPSA